MLYGQPWSTMSHYRLMGGGQQDIEESNVGPNVGLYGAHVVFGNRIHVGPIWAAHMSFIWVLYGSYIRPMSHPGRFNLALNGTYMGPISHVGG